MRTTQTVRTLLDGYRGERPGVTASLSRMLMHGRLAGTGRMVILPVDQGVEHGPAQSFAANPQGYDPLYFFELALEAGLSALAAPLGLLAVGADRHAGEIPLILKANNANRLGAVKDEAITATVRDALELGCSGIGYTIYPGSDRQYDMFEEVREGASEARAHGLAVVVWAYPRGGMIDAAAETALDIVAYGAQIAAQLGAHIIKVKLPTQDIALPASRDAYGAMPGLAHAERRVAHVMDAAFAGRRIVLFSGGPSKATGSVLDEARAIRAGGGHGSIIGRNVFQRSRSEALAMLDDLIAIYQSGGERGDES